MPPQKRSTPKNPMGADVRALVLQRDRFRCRFCGTQKFLEVHHIHYRSEHKPEPNDEKNLITLCSIDHARVHSSKERWQSLLEETISSTYSGVMLTIPQVEARRDRAVGTDSLQE